MYGYATSVFSSRKIERATHDSVAFRFIAANSSRLREPDSAHHFAPTLFERGEQLVVGLDKLADTLFLKLTGDLVQVDAGVCSATGSARPQCRPQGAAPGCRDRDKRPRFRAAGC